MCVLVEDFQKLQRAKETLTNEERRARYDHWRRSRVPVPFQQWETLSSSLRTVSGAHPGPPQTPWAPRRGGGGAGQTAGTEGISNAWELCCRATPWGWGWCRDIPALWMPRKFWTNSQPHSQKGIRPLILEWIYRIAAFIGSLSNLRAVVKCFSSLCSCRKFLFLFKVELKLGPFYNIFSSWFVANQIGFHAVWLNKDLIEKKSRR